VLLSSFKNEAGFPFQPLEDGMLCARIRCRWQQRQQQQHSNVQQHHTKEYWQQTKHSSANSAKPSPTAMRRFRMNAVGWFKHTLT